jgi:two-component system NarL family response regulator
MILIASHSPETLARATRAAESLAMISSVTDLASLRTSMEKSKPRMVLIDMRLPGIDRAKDIVALQRLSLDTRVVILGVTDCDEDELALFNYGVRGCCPIDSDEQHYQRVISAVLRGEVWIRRSLTARLLEQLSQRMLLATVGKRPTNDMLDDLTKREREIANLVAGGQSNKIIARQLDITERTVKAHLTEVFRKLGVTDRLKLAVLISSEAESTN